jgi:hypothetical protein
MDSDIFHHFADGGKLALAAVDQQEVGPLAALAIGILFLEPGKAPLEHFAHHREIVARLRLRPFDIELAVAVLAEAFGPRDDHRAGRIGAHDVAVVIDFDPLGHVGKLERVGQLAEDLALRGGLGEPPVERFFGIAPRLVEQLAPSAALRLFDHDLAPGPLRKRFFEQLAVGDLAV